MIKRPLEQLFFATFRGKQDFAHFSSLDLSEMYEAKKFDGRTVYSPNRTLKSYLTFLSRILFGRLPVAEDIVYSYRKGVNVVNAVEKHARNKYFVQTDIKNFFQSINRQQIKQTIEDSEHTCPISDLNESLERILDIVTIDGVLPPGYPTSPAISNACLYKFDQELASVCKEEKIIYSRYADDLIFSADAISVTESIIPKATKILDEVFMGHLKINESKTKVTLPGQKIRILGVSILPNGKVTIDGKLKKNIETCIYYFLRDKSVFIKLMKEADNEKSTKKISGQLNYINTVDPSFLDKLRKKYGIATIDQLLHYSAE
ncbi:reverse transcriptase domain-containing protein [Pseudomonas orientalis]|uniref:reverse transcriptase domain-containing protein n=1 Tax=Pseudomonas orientalis TaxID=76758 RepID=UPI0034D78EAD